MQRLSHNVYTCIGSENRSIGQGQVERVLWDPNHFASQQWVAMTLDLHK